MYIVYAFLSYHDSLHVGFYVYLLEKAQERTMIFKILVEHLITFLNSGWTKGRYFQKFSEGFTTLHLALCKKNMRIPHHNKVLGLPSAPFPSHYAIFGQQFFPLKPSM
jgi:hypothetical protein